MQARVNEMLEVLINKEATIVG
jgi:hypothetical protein